MWTATVHDNHVTMTNPNYPAIVGMDPDSADDLARKLTIAAKEARANDYREWTIRSNGLIWFISGMLREVDRTKLTIRGLEPIDYGRGLSVSFGRSVDGQESMWFKTAQAGYDETVAAFVARMMAP